MRAPTDFKLFFAVQVLTALAVATMFFSWITVTWMDVLRNLLGWEVVEGVGVNIVDINRYIGQVVGMFGDDGALSGLFPDNGRILAALWAVRVLFLGFVAVGVLQVGTCIWLLAVAVNRRRRRVAYLFVGMAAMLSAALTLVMIGGNYFLNDYIKSNMVYIIDQLGEPFQILAPAYVFLALNLTVAVFSWVAVFKLREKRYGI
jgi:hypothetical protein